MTAAIVTVTNDHDEFLRLDLRIQPEGRAEEQLLQAAFRFSGNVATVTWDRTGTRLDGVTISPSEAR